MVKVKKVSVIGKRKVKKPSIVKIYTENKAEILLIKMYYSIISVLLGYESYKELEGYIKKIKYEIDVNGNQINPINILNALSKIGIFKLGFFFLDINNLYTLILDTINVLKLTNNKSQLKKFSDDITIRYIFTKFLRFRSNPI